MIYGSVCSGIEAATAAWHPLGWKPAWFSEVDPFCSALLRHHYPGVENHGDFTQIGADKGGAIDLLVGGTPCQDFSVAGLRAGLDGARGNLTLEFVRLADRLRPRWLVWENVPGVLSIDDGRAFGAFIGGLGKLGYGFAYRVLDAQYSGVPQRRRRVFVVGHLGDWRIAGAVLFEPSCLSGDSPPSRTAGKGVTGGIAVGPGGGEFTDLSYTLDARCKDGAIRNQLGMLAFSPEVAYGLNGKGGVGRLDAQANETFIAIQEDNQNGVLISNTTGSLRSNAPGSQPCGTLIAGPLCANGKAAGSATQQDAETGMLIVGTLPSGGTPKGHGTSGVNDQAVIAGHVIPHVIKESAIGRKPENGPQRGEVLSDGTCYTLNCTEEHAVVFDNRQGQTADVTPTVRSGCHGALPMVAQPAVAVAIRGRDGGSTAEVGGDVANALRVGSGGGGKAYAMTRMAIRRLTPRECERLQGFPDDYTLIPYPTHGKSGKPLKRKRTAKDGPRYKAIGNSMAVPVMRWIGERIQAVDELLKEINEKR